MDRESVRQNYIEMNRIFFKIIGLLRTHHNQQIEGKEGGDLHDDFGPAINEMRKTISSSFTLLQRELQLDESLKEKEQQFVKEFLDEARRIGNLSHYNFGMDPEKVEEEVTKLAYESAKLTRKNKELVMLAEEEIEISEDDKVRHIVEYLRHNIVGLLKKMHQLKTEGHPLLDQVSDLVKDLVVLIRYLIDELIEVENHREELKRWIQEIQDTCK
jgi:hypothetical protein